MIKNLKINKKKIMSLLTATILSFTSGAGAVTSDEKYSKLPIIYQRDEMFYENEIKYGGYYFRDCGCGPSSIINMLISIFEYESDDMIPFVKEVLRAFSNSHSSDRYGMSVDSFMNILNSDYIKENRGEYPILSNLLKKKNGEINSIKDIHDFDVFEEVLSNKKDNKTIIFQGKILLKDNWKEIINLICHLYDIEEYDTNLYFAYASVGTTDCTAPFHSGDGGHYVCMSINVKEFYENGTFCILDSYRRAIFDEPYGDNEYYRRIYPFAEKPMKYKDFNEIFNIERLSSTVIKCSLSEDYKSKLEDIKSFSKVNRSERVADYLTPLYKYVVFYGGALLVVDIPSKEKVYNAKNGEVEESDIYENNKRY